jgi:hypothetical protein
MKKCELLPNASLPIIDLSRFDPLLGQTEKSMMSIACRQKEDAIAHRSRRSTAKDRDPTDVAYIRRSLAWSGIHCACDPMSRHCEQESLERLVALAIQASLESDRHLLN